MSEETVDKSVIVDAPLCQKRVKLRQTLATQYGVGEHLTSLFINVQRVIAKSENLFHRPKLRIACAFNLVRVVPLALYHRLSSKLEHLWFFFLFQPRLHFAIPLFTDPISIPFPSTFQFSLSFNFVVRRHWQTHSVLMSTASLLVDRSFLLGLISVKIVVLQNHQKLQPTGYL